MPNTPHRLCVMLRDLRQAAGMSLKQMGGKHGVSPVALGAYERGDRLPPITKLDQLLGVFGYRLSAEPIGSGAVRASEDVVAELRAIADQLESARAG
jgi:transcriptional regulator with XRE-family HTH domain